MSNYAPDFNMRIDGIVVLLAIDSLKKYLDLIEAQIKKVWEEERKGIESEPTSDEEEYDLQRTLLRDVNLNYETELFPALRYSFIVLLHIVTENELRKFCSAVKNERGFLIGISDLNGSVIDQIWTFLSKVAAVPTTDLPNTEWQKLKSLQKVRNCIVHAHGWVKEDDKFFRQFALAGSGVTVGPEGRLQIEKMYCDQQLENLHSLFNRLFKLFGWS